MRAERAAIDFKPWCTATEPVAQTRVASEVVKSCGEKPLLKWPRTISSTSFAAITLIGELAERCMRPTHNAGRHDCSLLSLSQISVAFAWSFLLIRYGAPV